jgi:DNA-binding response OmpR family regulator
MGPTARILVVDDDRPTVMIIERLLKKDGYDVCTAFDGKEGLQRAQAEKPDLIILDLMMPKMDGYEVCYRLKNDPDTADIAVLMLTAKGGIENSNGQKFAARLEDRLRGFEVGAVDFLIKPIKAKDLAKRVKALLWAGGF